MALTNAISAAVVGGLCSLFHKSDDRRHKETVDAIKQIKRDVRRERVVVVFVRPGGHEVREQWL